MAMNDEKRDLYLAELPAMRAELNAVIDRMNANENFSAGALSAIYAFVLTNAFGLVSIVLALASLTIVALGYHRYRELRGHARDIDEYLRAIETQLSETGGWTEHFYSVIMKRKRLGFTVTRNAYWSLLTLSALIGCIYVASQMLIA